MSKNNLRKKYGIVILLDALGAASYSDKKIKSFLSARNEINKATTQLCSKEMTKSLGDIGVFHVPEIFTFGDTVIITIPLKSKKHRAMHLYFFTILMKRYLFDSLANGILFRGSFSIGDYIADSDSNTVMGNAVSDAAAWYEQSEWMGLSSTPKTNFVLEHLIGEASGVNALDSFQRKGLGWLMKYNVPHKNGTTHELYSIDWATAFFDKDFLEYDGKEDPELYFLELMQSFNIPKGTELKYINTKVFFDYCKEKHE